MRVLLFLLLSISICRLSQGQTNRYSNPANANFENTYTPINYNLLLLLGANANKNARQADEYIDYSKQNVDLNNNQHYYYIQKAYEALNEKRLFFFLAYSKAALSTSGIPYRNLYYNMGVAYYLTGEKRKSKRYLKKAKKLGHKSANIVLDLIKKKQEIDYSLFEIDERYIKK